MKEEAYLHEAGFKLSYIFLHIATATARGEAFDAPRPSWHLRRALGESRLITKVTCNHGRAETVSSDQGSCQFFDFILIIYTPLHQYDMRLTKANSDHRINNGI